MRVSERDMRQGDPMAEGLMTGRCDPRVRVGRLVTTILMGTLLLVGAGLVQGCRAGGSPGRGADALDSSPAAPPAPENARVAAIGEAVSEPPVTLVVVSSGPARLDPQAPPPAVGSRFVEVRTRLTNSTKADLPINASPYSVYNTELLVDGVSHPGSLVVRSTGPVRTGVIPPGTTLDLRYVFEVPDNTADGTFLWPPSSSSTERPVISVEVAGLAAQ